MATTAGLAPGNDGCVVAVQSVIELADPERDDSRVVCVDLNGVLDSYSGWRGAEHFNPPRAGAREFLEAFSRRGYRIVVFTTRHPEGVPRWARTYGLDHLIADVTDRKPAAHVFVDDRDVCFRGDFDATLDEIDGFAAHWEAPHRNRE